MKYNIKRENFSKFILTGISGKIPEKLPIGNTFGRGFEFEYDGKRYHTEPCLNKDGKLRVFATLSTWEGIVGGASHYYGHIQVVVNNKGDDGRIIGGYMGGIKIPKENETLELDVCRPLNEDEIAQITDPNSSFYGYEEELPTVRFNSREDALDAIYGVFNALFDVSKCELEIYG